MKIALGCDHGGYAMKEDIKKQLEGLGHEVKDCGTYSTENHRRQYPLILSSLPSSSSSTVGSKMLSVLSPQSRKTKWLQ